MALGPFRIADKVRDTAQIGGTVLLMRHGETAWNREGRVMGRQPVEIDSAGRAQVEAALPLARILNPDVIISSPLLRARQSAEIIASGIGKDGVLSEPDLEEVRYGRWEGMTYHQLVTDKSYLEYRKAPLTSELPGGETIVEVQQRGVAAVHKTVRAFPKRRALLVSHGDIIRTIVCHFLGLDLSFFHRIRVDNASFFGIEIGAQFAEIKFMNLLPDAARAFTAPFEK